MSIIVSLLLIVALYFGFRLLIRFMAVYAAMQPFLKAFRAAKKSYHTTSNTQTNREKTKSSSPENMVQCAVCDLYIPQKDAIIKNGKIYCSPEHATQ